jgi:hypothetical protein
LIAFFLRNRHRLSIGFRLLKYYGVDKIIRLRRYSHDLALSLRQTVSANCPEMEKRLRHCYMDTFSALGSAADRRTGFYWPYNRYRHVVDLSDATLSSILRNPDRLLSPRIEVCYLHSSFEGKGVTIKATLPSQPLFRCMAVRLALSLGLILLLMADASEF